MTKFTQAIVAAASSIALFGGAMTLITPSSKAQGYAPMKYSDAARMCNGMISTQNRGGSYVYVCTGQPGWIVPASDR